MISLMKILKICLEQQLLNEIAIDKARQQMIPALCSLDWFVTYRPKFDFEQIHVIKSMMQSISFIWAFTLFTLL